MSQKQYVYIGLNQAGQKVFRDQKNDQILQGDQNVIYRHGDGKMTFWICLAGFLILLGIYKLNISSLGAGTCLIVSAVALKRKYHIA